MVRHVGSLIWLCWIFCSLLPLVQCQFGDGRFGNNPFSGGFGRGPIGDRFSNGGFGGRFRNGFSSGFGPGDLPFIGNGQRRPQQGQQEGSVENPQQENEATAPEASASAPEPAPVDTSTPISVPTDEVVASPPESISVPLPPAAPVAAVPIAEDPVEGAPLEAGSATPSRLTPLVPTSTATAIEDTISDVAAAPIPLPAVETTTSESFTDPLDSALPSQTPSTTSTITTSMIVVVTPTPTSADSDSGSPVVDDPSTTSTILDLSPLSTSAGGGMSPSARVGLGVGISFGIICIASGIGLYLWYRRQNQRHAREARGGGGGLGGFFMLNRQRSSKGDAEWEIANAEKVEILSGASARTVSRSDSRSTLPSRDGRSRDGDGGAKPGLQIVKVGMRMPERPHPALTSNPPIPSPSQFPTPPSSRGYTGNEKKTGSGSSWPLPE